MRNPCRESQIVQVEASNNYEGMLTEQDRVLEDGAALFTAGARDAASGTVRARLNEMAECYLATREAMEQTLRRWHERRRM